MMIYAIFLVIHKSQQKINNENNCYVIQKQSLCCYFKSSIKHKIYKTPGDVLAR